nr:hypothetical protein [Polyangiaceae bacterium]
GPSHRGDSICQALSQRLPLVKGLPDVLSNRLVLCGFSGNVRLKRGQLPALTRERFREVCHARGIAAKMTYAVRRLQTLVSSLGDVLHQAKAQG